MTRTILFAAAVVAALGLTATPALAQHHVHRVQSPQLSSDLYNYWIRTNDHVDINVPQGGAASKVVGCAAVSFMIGADGKVRDVKIQKVYPAKFKIFGRTAAKIVKGLHFKAAAGNSHDRPVATYYLVPFNVPSGEKVIMQKMLTACHLPGYGS